MTAPAAPRAVGAPARFFLAAVLALGVAFGFATTASATTRAAAQNAVGASTVTLASFVGVSGDVSPATHLESYDSQAITASATGVAANTGRGLSQYGGVVSETGTNAAGGRIVTSTGTIAQEDLVTFVQTGVMKGENVEILSGVHGYPNGTMIPEPGFFAADVSEFGSLPGVTVHNVAEMSAEEIAAILRGPGTIVGGFCDSAACLAPFQ